MYAVIKNYREGALDQCAGIVHSIHLEKDKALSSLTRQLTLQRIVRSKSVLCLAQLYNGRVKGQYVFNSDIVPLEVFNVEFINEQ